MTYPSWFQHDEDYHPTRDRDAFLSRSLLRVMSILFSLRAQGRRASRVPALWAVLLLVAWILFVVLAQTPLLLLAAMALELVLLATFSGAAIRRILGGSLAAALFSLLLVLPALVLSMGGGRAGLLPWKSFLTMAGVMMLAESLQWHDVTRALARLHVPETVIALFDTTLRAIYLLGEEAGTMLTALKLRSIGRNPHKSRAMGGVLGSLFLRSQHLSQATYEAMLCRGFVGTYGPQPYIDPCGGPDGTRKPQTEEEAFLRSMGFDDSYEFAETHPSPINRRLGLQPLAVADTDEVGRGDGSSSPLPPSPRGAGPEGRGVCGRSKERNGGTNDMFTFDDVCFAYEGVPALRHATFDIRRGDVVAILGPNGAGKSTLLRLLNGIVFPETGQYLFEDTKITAAKMREHRYSKWFHQRVGYVWQDAGAMLFCPTVREELAFGPEQMGLRENDIQERIELACTLLHIDEAMLHRAPYTLSGGEKKRVALAAILTVNPAVWTLDEPTASLDEDGLRVFSVLLHALRMFGKTILFSTHDEQLAKDFATKILRIHKDHTVTLEDAPATEPGH